MTEKIYSLDPLLERYAVPPNQANRTAIHELATRSGISRKSFQRYERNGMDAFQADRVAIRLGFHPVEIWPTWFDDGLKECSGLV